LCEEGAQKRLNGRMRRERCQWKIGKGYHLTLIGWRAAATAPGENRWRGEFRPNRGKIATILNVDYKDLNIELSGIKIGADRGKTRTRQWKFLGRGKTTSLRH